MTKKFISIAVFFIVLTGILTFPIIFKINNSILGAPTTDEPFAALWNFWWFKYAFQHQLKDAYYSIIAVPFGFDTGKRTLYPAWEFLYKWLSILTNHFISFNIQMLLSFILAGITMHYLVFYLTKKNIPSLLAGIIYAFCPYHFARAWQHLALAQIQWMPLYILTLIKLEEHPTYKRMFLAILSILLVICFEFHYVYFMYICSILFLFYYAFFYKRIGADYLKLVKLVFVILFIGALFILPSSAITGIKQMTLEKKKIQPSVFTLVRPFEDLFTQSAKPLSYFLPAPAHPILGEFTGQFIGSPLYGMSLTEHTLFLGWSPLILSFFAFIGWRRKKKLKDFDKQAYNREDFHIGFFIFMMIAAWIFSQPPWWKFGSIKILMPSFFMYKIFPVFRAYCRFGIVVMLAVAVLSGFGLKFILERFNNRKIKIIIMIFFGALILFEFWNYPPFKIIDASKFPAVYYWIKNQTGDFAIAEYPLDSDTTNEMYKFYQTVHEKKIINGTIPTTYANKISKTITKLSEHKTAAILKWMGVKYVLVHRGGYLQTDLIEEKEELNKIPQNKALSLVKSFPIQGSLRKDIICIQQTGPIDVYEVIASPIKPEIE